MVDAKEKNRVIQENALQYEFQVVKHHQEIFNQVTWHQYLIPEYVYRASGYINNFNDHRLTRIMNYRKGKSRPLLPDYGLDFISLDELNNTFHGGQAKLYENAMLTSKDCSTFKDCVAWRLVSKKGYLYTSRDKLEDNLRELIQMTKGQIEHVVLPFDDVLKSKKDETKLPLYHFQKEAIRAVLESETTKTLLRLTTGSGKTLIASHIVKRQEFKKLICVAPLLCSVEQLKTRISQFIPNHRIITVDCEGTTNVDDIHERMKDEQWVIYTTFKSFQNVVSHLDISFNDTFLLIDEVHNAVHNNVICTLANKFEQSLYLSATVPEELDIQLDYEEAYNYNIRTAIEDGVCVDYEIYLPYIDNMSLPQEIDHLDNSLCNKALFLATGMLQNGNRKCIVYLKSIEEANLFETVVKEVFVLYHGIDIKTYGINNKVPQNKRELIYEEFSKDYDTIKIIANVRILDEAIDLVACDCVYITHITDNVKTPVQRMGRAIRLDPNNPSKKAAMYIWCDDWEQCVISLQMLKTEDIQFHSKLNITAKDYDQQITTNEKVVQCEAELVKFVKIRCFTLHDLWELRRLDWASHYKRNGKNPSGYSKDLEEKRNNKWMTHIRQAYKAYMKGTSTTHIMNQERIQALEATEGWTWDSDSFETNLQNWITQYQNKGKPSENSKNIKEKRAGQWQGNMRKAYRTYMKGLKIIGTSINQERIQALELTEGWTWEEEDPFHTNLENWITQYQKKGSNPSKRSKNIEEKRAGIWQCSMRQAYRAYMKGLKSKNANRMNQERIQALDATEGWTWKR